MKTATRTLIKVADEVWIACALLHREHPRRADFEVSEIVERAQEEAIAGVLRPGVYAHAVQHCVANRAPNPGRYRMLYQTSKATRRLFRRGDAYHPAREGAKILPDKEEIPSKYHPLLEWYVAVYDKKENRRSPADSILELRGLGKEIWKGVDPDEYVRKLREG